MDNKIFELITWSSTLQAEQYNQSDGAPRATGKLTTYNGKKTINYKIFHYNSKLLR